MSHSEHVAEGGGPESTVMGAVDGDGSGALYVIADVNREEAWLSMSLSSSRALDAWA